MQAVARAVFAQIVDLRKAAARLWMIGTVLELAEIRQLRGFQRLRLDRDAARSRQLQRQADEPQREGGRCKPLRVRIFVASELSG